MCIRDSSLRFASPIVLSAARVSRIDESFIDCDLGYIIRNASPMSVIEERLRADVEVQQASNFSAGLISPAGIDDAKALKSIFRILWVFFAYLLLIELMGVAVPFSMLTHELLRFVPYCIF